MDEYKIPDEWRALSTYKPDRKVGGDMGKHDFLMLLSAQLRFQDPLEPVKDSDFAAQLAQFSALEQMENMNQTLAAMSNYQAYSLVGKLVIATGYVDGVLSELYGTVECIFTRDGVTYAQIGDHPVPINNISVVFDSTSMLTPQMLIETSNNLIGRVVKAQVEKVVIEGVVTGVFVDDGNLWARIAESSSGKVYEVQVGCIYDIKQPGTVEPPVGEEEPDDLDDEENTVGQTVSVPGGPDDNEDPVDDENPVGP